MDGALLPLRRFPDRLGDRRFWNIQMMVLAATVPHYVIEEVGFTNPFETFHGLAITLYVIPLLYAALSFGWEGAILTALWITALTSPSMWVWHRSGYHWLTEAGQLAITLPAGIMVAWRVDLETKQRLRAERTSASLSLLNEIGEQLGHRLEVEDVLPAVIERIQRGLPVEAAWLCLDAVHSDADRRIIREPPGASAADIGILHDAVRTRREPVCLEGRLIGVPLATERGVSGSLGVAVPAGSDAMLVDEHTRVLASAAHEISVAIENAGLYRERQESLQTYVRQVTQAQEDERLRIARELHDETAQELVHLVRRLERLGETAAADDMVRQVDDLLGLTRGTLRSVRRFSRDLRPSVLDDLGLVPAIELAVEGTNAQLPSGARLNVGGEPRRLEPAVELALFRITQEALHNIEKHAEAASATVELTFTADAVQLVVSDDGRGWQPPARVAELAGAGKLGILGMKERAQLVGGRFDVQAAEGQGSRITVTVDTGASQPRATSAH
jgi:signal transduction histidine kinase